MKTIAYIQFIVLLSPLVLADSAFAQVYKCTTIDANSQQAKVAYTNMPCDKSAKQSVTDISEIANKSVKNQTVKYTGSDLGNAVTQAVLNKNFALAKSLANTKEHWRIIAMTESAGQAPPIAARDESINMAKGNTENACERAQYDFDSTSRLYWRDRELVAAKKSVMFALCGVPEQVQPIVVAQPHAQPYGIHKTRWYPPHYAGNPTSAYHRPLPHVNHYTGDSFNINYRSKHFGVQLGGYDQQSTRFGSHTEERATYGW